MEAEARTEHAPDIVPFRTPHCTGRVAASARQDLEPLIGAADPGEWPALEVVKRSTVRTVLAGTVGGRAVHVKLFRPARLADRARDAARGGRGGREFDKLGRARARGLDAVEPLAEGTFAHSWGSRSFLVTATVPGGRPMAPGGWSGEEAEAAGGLLRRAHDRGLHAPDLHPGNIVVAGGRPWLLDLTSARFAQPLEDEDRARALAFFCQGLDGGVHDPVARPLVRAYAEGGEEAPRFVRLFEAAARRGRRVRYRALIAFGRRAERDCRHTATERPRRRGGPRWFRFLPEAGHHRAAQALVADPAGTGAERIKSGRRGGVWRSGELVLKDRDASHARRLFRAAYWLRYAGVPTAAPVLLHTFAGRGQVVVRRLPGPDLATALAEGRPGKEELLAAARDLGRSLGRLHAHGLRNRDLKLENLVYDADGRIAVVDLDGIRLKTVLDTRGQAADLGRLLAAWQEAGSPGGRQVAGAFVRTYGRTRRRLLLPLPDPEQLRQAARRAGEWHAAHRPSAD